MKLGTISGGQNITRIAQRLSAYIPKSLAVHVLRGDTPTSGYERRLQAATLFCDLSGFSTMASELSADGPRGAEELNRILLMTFTAMINAIHNAGGVVSHFHGDAMMVYFPDDDEQAAEHALACAQFMQNLIQGGYSQVIANRPGNKQTVFELSMKVGVGYGDCLEVIVGDPNESLEFIVAGNAVDEAVAAESHAQSGQVFATHTVLRKASLPAVDPYRLVTEILPVPYAQTSIHWDAYSSEQLWQLANLAAAFVPDALHERITANHAYFVAEHRPATSMFVRYEGINYSQPEAGQQLQEYYEWARQIVMRFGGENSRINRVLTGDKGSLLHIIFGAPVAPEAPEQALHCALTLQKEKPSFITSQQIGVATGQVFACAVGSQNRREYTIVGDVVNLSSRLMTRCAEGRVLTDGATANRAKNQIQFKLIGQESFKGFAEPIRLLEAEEVKEIPSPVQHRFHTDKQSLFWRKKEQRQLLDELEQTRQGHHRAVAIFGSSSAEQTRLTNLAASRWLAHNGRLLAGMGQQHTADIPFGIWQPVWRDFFNLSSDMSNQAQIKAVMTQMKHYNPHFTKEDVWLWCNQIGLSVSPVQGSEWGLEKRLDGMILMTQMCFRAAAIEHPLLIVLENLQWIDPYSLRLLNSVATQWQHAPIMLLMTFTPSSKLSLDQLPHTTTIPLEELSITAGHAMVKELLAGHEPPVALLRHLGLTETDGAINPIFLEESINMMRDDGILQITDQIHLDEAGLARLRIPDNVQSLLRARFDRISAAGRTLLQSASVIGRQFDLETLTQAISDLSSKEAETLLNELRDARLISSMNSGLKTIYYFNDDMIQEIAYESIPYGRRQRWHAAVADWLYEQNRENLQPLYPVLAYHYGQTDLHQRGLEFALAAAKDIQAVIAPQAAIEFYNIAENHLNALDDPKNWHKLLTTLLERAELWYLIDRYETALQDVEQAIELALERKNGLHVGLGYSLMARIKCRLGEYEEAIELADLIIRGLASRIPPNKVGEAWATHAEALTYSGKFSQARSSYKKALDIFTHTQDREGLIHTHLLWAYEYSSMLGKWDEARQHFSEAQALLTTAPHPYPIEQARLSLGLTQVELRDGSPEAATQRLNEAKTLIFDHGITWWRPVYFYFQGALYIAQQEFEKAQDVLRKGVTAVQEGGNPDYLPLLLLELAHLAPDDQGQKFLKRCVTAAKERSRYLDRLHCLQVGQTYGF